MAAIHSSTGIFRSIPASAISALEKAIMTPETFLFTQGISTRPATGSQTSPIWLMMAIPSASPEAAGLPPINSTRAAAAIPDAEPHSAWHPPSAPAIEAVWAITIPNAPAVKMDITISLFGSPLSSYMETRQPGRIPQEPAVGVATILPIAALQLDTHIALPMAFVKKIPESPPPVFSAYCSILLPSPPVSPDVERRSGSFPFFTASTITSKFFSMMA